jgi:hypothetical protein
MSQRCFHKNLFPLADYLLVLARIDLEHHH